MDDSDFKKAKEATWKVIEISDSKRKKDTSMIFTTNGNDYTDQECHAEMIFSESQRFYGDLCVASDQSILGFIKGAYRTKLAYNVLKKCERIMHSKTNWKSDILREEFIAGVNMSLGVFEMIISLIPRRFRMLIELAGFSSSQNFVMDKLILTTFPSIYNNPCFLSIN